VCGHRLPRPATPAFARRTSRVLTTCAGCAQMCAFAALGTVLLSIATAVVYARVGSHQAPPGARVVGTLGGGFALVVISEWTARALAAGTAAHALDTDVP
jgi:hypothetical protein